ncbi:unnamed protein product [Parnassius apollo]|uniref:(apollo) hypothetical protein n=1 Tax=Parnassius apollo TaxID=110799 RepID=A0A8S3XE15_PARAO|nr:unnamed protein product [Parnassius apollo]
MLEKFDHQLNLTVRFVETNARSIQSLSRTTADEFQSLAKVITHTQDALKQSSEVMNENFDMFNDSLKNMSRAEELTQAITLTLIELTECNAKTSLLETSLLTSAEFYVYFSDAMVSGNLLLSLVHTSQVVEVMKSITQSLPESLALPPAILFDEMLSHIPVKVGVNAGHVILVMTVPIIKKPRHYFTVKMITHPLYIVRYLIVPAIYPMCGAPTLTKTVVHMLFYVVIRSGKVFITPIDTNTWLITHNAETRDLAVICRNGTKTSQSTKTQSQTRLILPANCIAKIDGYKIEPTQEILDSVKSESLVGDKYVFGDLPELKLDTIDFDSTNIASARLKRANEVFNVSAPQVEGSVAKLSDLITNSRNATKTYHSDIEILTNEIIKLKKKVAEDAAAGFSIGRSHRVFEIPIELCTIPGRAMAWSCTPSKGYTQLLEQNQSVKRWSNAMVMKLDLRQISLVNSDYPSLKWSQNVPSKVKVNLNHLGHIINHHARWDWLSLNIVSVTGLGISFPGTFRYIYHYSKPASVNYPHTGAVTVDDEWDGDLEL